MVRLHSMDALRAVAMFLGVVLHALMSYQVSPRAEWPQDPNHNFVFYDWLYTWIHAFRMPLFFLVAGFFARFLYYKIGQRQFLKHRYNRIFIPLSLGLFTVLPLSTFPFQFYRFLDEGLNGWNAVQAAGMQSLQWNGLLHLWFLYYLIVMYLIMILFIKIGTWLKISRLTHFSFQYSPLSLLLLGIVLTIILFTFYNLKVEPWHGAVVKVGQLLYYGLFFFIGYTMQRNINTLNSGVSHMYTYLMIGTILQVSLYFVGDVFAFKSLPWLFKLVHNLLSSLQTIFLTFGMLAFFMKIFQKEHKFIRYFSDASYWIYLIHFPIVVGLQITFMDSLIPGIFRFWVVIFLTTLITIITYHLFVRYSFLGVALHGRRKKETFSIKLVKA